MKSAHKLIMDIPLTPLVNTFYEISQGLKQFEPLNVMVPVYKNGDKKKLYELNGYEFLIKAIYGNCTKDELKTLHKKDSIVNEVIKSLTSETTHYLNNASKNVINTRLFQREDPKKISDERLEEKPKEIAQEFRDFVRLCNEGIVHHNLQYRSASGNIVTLQYALADPNYEIDKGMPWFVINEEEAPYFNKYGYFPLRSETNSKLGNNWVLTAFELAWLCSGDAHGGCQCPEFCYAKRMEGTYKNTRTRVLKFMNAWKNHSFDEKVQYYTNIILNNKNGIRFCDTGDVTNQALLDEIFKLVTSISIKLREDNINPIGRFYIYSTRADLDWSNKPWELILNASNKELYEKVPDANWFRVIKSFDEIEEQCKKDGIRYDTNTLHICNCNCKACDYCSICRNQIIWEILG